jgi:hypothetical protein
MVIQALGPPLLVGWYEGPPWRGGLVHAANFVKRALPARPAPLPACPASYVLLYLRRLIHLKHVAQILLIAWLPNGDPGREKQYCCSAC